MYEVGLLAEITGIGRLVEKFFSLSWVKNGVEQEDEIDDVNMIEVLEMHAEAEAKFKKWVWKF